MWEFGAVPEATGDVLETIGASLEPTGVIPKGIVLEPTRSVLDVFCNPKAVFGNPRGAARIAGLVNQIL